jgi:GTP:adenosylcobinamide-phosphate guanylyltransferase
MNYKLCILAAGKGTRNQSIQGLHKCLLPINNKPVISHILDNFPKEIKVVIAVGWKSNQIKSYLNKVHSGRNITFVDVDNYDKPGAGPGYSLLSCKEELSCPFIFTAADTLIDYKFSQNLCNNWVGGSKIKNDDAFRYCLMKTNQNKELINFYYGSYSEDSLCFTGIAGVHDHDQFWKSLSNNKKINGEHQVINGFVNLKKISIHEHKFYDTGNEESYRGTKKIFPNDLAIEKDNEAIFIDNNIVVKYFSSSKKCSDRIKRYEQLIDSAPKISKVNENMFSYKYLPGKKLSDVQDKRILKYFFKDYQSKFRKPLIEIDKNDFLKNCDKMYRQKTLDRIKFFIDSPIDHIKYVNGKKVKRIKELISLIDWEKIYKKAIPSSFHGDMQPENIIVSEDKFSYIDWRESFGSSISVGDSYYDLSKCYHALLISNELILQGNYDLRVKESSAELSFLIKNNLNNLISNLKEFCIDEGYDYNHIKLLSAIIYLNIASLYQNFEDGKYGKFLFLLGKLKLMECLNDEN